MEICYILCSDDLRTLESQKDMFQAETRQRVNAARGVGLLGERKHGSGDGSIPSRDGHEGVLGGECDLDRHQTKPRFPPLQRSCRT